MKIFSRYIYVLFAALFVLAGCGGGGASSVNAVSGSSRTVSITSNPANGATNVPLNQAVAVTFNNTMIGSTVNTSTFTVNGGAGNIAGTISPTGNVSTYTFTPSAPLSPNTTYTVTLSSSIKISAGYNLQATLTFSFTTAAGPANLYYGSTTALKAVNPNTPAAASNVTVSNTAVTGAVVIESATYTQATSTLSNIAPKTVMYAKGGKIYGSSATAPATVTQISNETGATQICAAVAAPDYANHGNAAYIYALPGVDTACNTTDDVYKMVKTSYSSATAPTAAFKVISVIHDPLSGAVSGYLALNQSTMNLNRYDANFANPSLVLAITSGAIEVMPTTFANVYLVLNGGLYNYSYNAGTWSLSALLHTFANPPATSLAGFDDGTTLYFADGGIVYKIAHAATTPTIVVNDGNTIANMVLTSNRVVFGKNTLEVKSILKSAVSGTATILVAANGTLVGASPGGKVYYTLTTVGNPTAGVVNEDGTGTVEVTNSNWAGHSLPTTYVGAGNQWPSKILLIDSTGVLKAIDPATGTPSATLGTVTGLDPFTFFAYGNGNYLLGTAQDAATGATNTDVYFVDANTAASLQRLTTTAGEHEYLVK